MKIAFVSTYPPIHCGVGEYTKFLLGGLSSIQRHGKFYVIASRDVGEEYFDTAVSAHVMSVFEKRKPQTYSRILNILSEVNGVDVLHIQHEYGIFGTSAKILEIAKEAKEEGLADTTLITMHTVHHPYTIRPETLEFQKKLGNYVDAVIVHSVVQEFELYSQGIDPRRVHRIPHGTFVNPYLGYPRPKLASSLGIVYDKLRFPIITLMGFLRPDKGLDVLVEALGTLKDINATLVIGGEVRDSEIKYVVYKLLNSGHIFIEKYLSDEEMLMLASLADIILLPYKDKPGAYSVSGVLHLSMGSLKPVIGTSVPRLIELYQYAPRFVVKPNDPKELAFKIKWLAENYELAVAYASSLYSYAVRTQWIRMARRHLALYNMLLGKVVDEKIAIEPLHLYD